MARLAGKVALITGAARGQGRAHAIRIAEEGGDVIAVDICRQLDTVSYPLATRADLDETCALVERHGRRAVPVEADVRDLDGLTAACDAAIARLGGRLDLACANAGIATFGRAHELSAQMWRETIDTNLTGAWHLTRVAIPHMMDSGRGGCILLVSSIAGLRGCENAAHYAAAKHGLVGLMRSLALELGSHSIRVNSIHPTQVDTPMLQNDEMYRLFCPELAEPTVDTFAPRSQAKHVLPTPWVDARDVSNAVVFLASDEGRYITGATLAIDAGATIK